MFNILPLAEKHKTYHIKDQQLSRDGFKKFLKTESCPYERCRFSRICNHIHCVRENCYYVLHSSGQLLSHKRKHDRMDSEKAYRRFKMAQKSQQQQQQQPQGDEPNAPIGTYAIRKSGSPVMSRSSSAANLSISPKNVLSSGIHYNTAALPMEILLQMQQERTTDSDNLEDTIPKTFIHTGGGGEELELMIKAYFTDRCASAQCEPLNLQHWQTTAAAAQRAGTPLECADAEAHLHCTVNGCGAIVTKSLADLSEHIQHHHEMQRAATASVADDEDADGLMHNPGAGLMQITSIDGFFNRKRGRPPKNRVVEVYNNVNLKISRILEQSLIVYLSNSRSNILRKRFLPVSSWKSLRVVDELVRERLRLIVLLLQRLPQQLPIKQPR